MILLGVDLPDISGHDVQQNLKKMPETKTIPIIFLRQHEPKDDFIGMRLGGDELILKPFDPEEVMTKVAYAVEAGRRAKIK
jgi:DNA-binding response OmpR family regulator